MTTLPTIRVKQSNLWGGLRFEDAAGNLVTLDDAMTNGFVVTSDDAPLICTLAQNWMEAKELNAR